MPIPTTAQTARILFLAILAAIGLPCSSVHADVVKAVSDGPRWTDEGSAFVLDEKGSVWSFSGGFERPLFDGPFKMDGLSDIVDIAPFAAVRKDGKVLTWRLGPQPNVTCSETCGPIQPVGTYTSPTIVDGIEGAVKIV